VRLSALGKPATIGPIVPAPDERFLRKFLVESTVLLAVSPCSPIVIHRRFGGTYCLHLQGLLENQATNQKEAGSKGAPLCFLLVSHLPYSLTLKMEAIRSFETSVTFYGTARRFIPEDGAVRRHRGEILSNAPQRFLLALCTPGASPCLGYMPSCDRITGQLHLPQPFANEMWRYAAAAMRRSGTSRTCICYS
jgi:hypothetical protein